MIRALIVDDEKLVRKGLIAVFPWEKYNISIVGEASNGKAALDFMRQHTVDLVFVDLTMPIMTGFELMKEVRREFTTTFIVVLTCHQDFNYIQEALRMGAIDYIVKTQLDGETIEETLRRITSRMDDESSRTGHLISDSGRASDSLSGGVLVNLDHVNGKSEKPPLDMDKVRWVELSGGNWFFYQMNEVDIYDAIQEFFSRTNKWIYIDVCELNRRILPSVFENLHLILSVFMFYKYTPDKKFYQLSYPSFSQVYANQSLSHIEAEWSSLKWIKDEESFQKLLELTSQAKTPVTEIAKWTRRVIDLFSTSVLNDNVGTNLEVTGKFRYWYQWVSWFGQFRIVVSRELQKFNYSTDVTLSIMKALLILNEAETFDFSRDTLALKFNMSPGYFSQCFKDIVGRSYGDYLREKKLIRGIALLAESDDSVFLIAERAGFQDEKYFSKLFRDYVGVNPTEYRKELAKGVKKPT